MSGTFHVESERVVLAKQPMGWEEMSAKVAGQNDTTTPWSGAASRLSRPFTTNMPSARRSGTPSSNMSLVRHRM